MWLQRSGGPICRVRHASARIGMCVCVRVCVCSLVYVHLCITKNVDVYQQMGICDHASEHARTRHMDDRNSGLGQ